MSDHFTVSHRRSRSVCRFGSVACLLALLVFVSCARRPTTETVTIDNVAPRRDVNGRIIDAHGGCLQFFNDRFYLYGNAFGTNQGYSGPDEPFVVYSSPNLQDWTFVGKLLQNPPKGIYYRPYVVFNARTKKYVLWYNWYQKLWQGQTGVAVSDNPAGPFTIVNPKVNLIGSWPGDGSLFVDHDGRGYFIYTDISNDYSVRVELLTPDYLQSTRKSSNILGTGAEAPLLFRRGNIYYGLCGPLCSGAAKGSEVQVFMSASPLGPFATEPSYNINRRSIGGGMLTRGSAGNNASAPPSTNAPKGKWLTYAPQSSVPNIPAQETWIAQIPSAAGPIFFWMGDRWESSLDGTRGHDFQFWSPPLRFTSDGMILPIQAAAKWYISWDLNR